MVFIHLIFIIFSIINFTLAIEITNVNTNNKLTLTDDYHYVTGSFIKNTNITGWDILEIKTNKEIISLNDIYYTRYIAGYIEGKLTYESIDLQWLNFYDDNFGDDLPDPDVIQFIIENYEYMIKHAMMNYQTSDYWFFLYTMLLQLNGLVDGYQSIHNRNNFQINPENIPQFNTIPKDDTLLVKNKYSSISILLKVLLMNSWGDLYTITTKMKLDDLLDDTKTKKIKRISYPKKANIEKDLRCSSFFKLLPDYSDIFFGHTTWCSYEAMGPRIFKYISLPVAHNIANTLNGYNNYQIEIRNIWFSSSAALFASLDDFYISKSSDLTTQLVIIETTNDVYNPKLFDLVTSQSNLCWIRSILASSIAVNSKHWTELFSIEPSGTYTNQWQILDMVLFIPGKLPPPNTFWLLEEIPGLIEAEDMTSRLIADSYWASYNIPFFQNISDLSGNTACCKYEQDGKNASCWETNPRANIFRQQQATILGHKEDDINNNYLSRQSSSTSSYEQMKSLLQYNDWENDPLSLNDPHYAISARNDLKIDAKDVYPSGGVDSKISSVLRSKGANQLLIDLHYGPTSDDQPVFCWSEFESKYNVTYSHYGQPDCANFNWTTYPL